MSKAVLVAGKDMPSSNKFVDGLTSSQRMVIVTEAEDGYKEDSSSASAIGRIRKRKVLGKTSGLVTQSWNRSSPISARTLVMTAEHIYEQLTEVILYFDEDLYASKAEQLDIQECSTGVDTMILSYQYLAIEALDAFSRKNDSQNPGTLIFLLKDAPSLLDAFHTPALHNGAYALASPVVASAKAAFASFAENIAALYSESDYASVVLVRGDKSMDSMGNESALAKWLCGYLDSLEQVKKSDTKKTVQWIRPGAKVQSSSGFSLFQKSK